MVLKPHIFVAAVILEMQDKILLAQRPKGKDLTGYWEFPGGKIEKNETPKQALVRELKEELNIKILEENLKSFNFVTYEYDKINLTMLVFKCNKWEGEIEPQENQLTKWIKLDNINECEMPPADIPIIQKLLEQK